MYVPHERRRFILAILEQRGYIRTAAIADELKVTEETVRNDLIYLQKQGLLQRVRAGARYLPPTGNVLNPAHLSSQYTGILQQLLPKGCCVYADDTPLMRCVLTHLDEGDYSVVTPSLSLAQSLCVPAIPHRVLLPSGTLHKSSHLIDAGDDSDMVSFLYKHRPDIALLCPPVVADPYSISYHHALQARWAVAAARTSTLRFLVIMPDVKHSLSANRIQLTPNHLIGPENLPSEFHYLPHNFFPIVTADDIREAVQS